MSTKIKMEAEKNDTPERRERIASRVEYIIVIVSFFFLFFRNPFASLAFYHRQGTLIRMSVTRGWLSVYAHRMYIEN